MQVQISTFVPLAVAPLVTSRQIPDPTPVAGIWPPPRDEKPCEVMVTTESRTLATTAVRSASGAALALAPDPADVGTPALVAAAGVGVGAASGPATRAAVPPAAMTADRTAAAMMDPVPPDPRSVRRLVSGRDQ